MLESYIECSSFEECFIESIKCHHNEFAEYIEINFLKQKNDDLILPNVLCFHNYAYLPYDFDNANDFFYLCRYNYITIVNCYIKMKEKLFKEITNDKITLKEAANNNLIDVIYYLLLDKKSVTKELFTRNDNLSKIVIPSSIKSLENESFYGCKSLTEVVFFSSLKSIGKHALDDCESLKEIIIPSSVESIGARAFNYCKSLKEITIPSSVTSIGRYAFFCCSLLKKVTILSPSLIFEDGLFSSCSSLPQIYIPSSIMSIKTRTFSQCY